jgi:hypothetical protein
LLPAVRPIARDRVERVRDREHARAERDLVADEAVRVAASVPALVVRTNDRQAFGAHERDSLEHLLAEHGVRLDQTALGNRQWRGFLEHSVRDPDLAEVVQQEAVLDARVVQQLGRAHACELDGVELHALRMGTRARVLRLERAGERGDCVVIRSVEQRPLLALDLEEMTEVARVQQELLLRVDASRRTERHAVHSAGEALDDRQQLERAEGLFDQCVGARAVKIRELGAGQEDDRNVPCLRRTPKRSRVLEPVDPRHENVEHDHVRLAGGDASSSHRRAVGLVELEVEDLERRAE